MVKEQEKTAQEMVTCCLKEMAWATEGTAGGGAQSGQGLDGAEAGANRAGGSNTPSGGGRWVLYGAVGGRGDTESGNKEVRLGYYG